MYVINFRIPFRAFGRVNYINGAALSDVSYEKGVMIEVEEIAGTTSLSCAPAEVVESRATSGRDYGFRIIW